MQLQNVLVIGAGTMGSGIAQWLVQAGLNVTLADNNYEQTEKAYTNIHKSWQDLLTKKKFSETQTAQFKKNLQLQKLNDVTADFDLVIEAIIEDLGIKKKLFQELDAKIQTSSIFASNTSSFSIEEIAKNLSSERKNKFIGLHFFNPATVMKLVEIIQTPDSNPEIAQDLYQWFEAKDKKPALCKDSPAFIVNRVARNFYGEALRIVEQYDLEKIKEVDLVMKEVAGFKMGPFELMDLIGIDINYSVTTSVWNAYKKIDRFAPHSLQKQMVDENKLGKKTKEGFYQYE
ncbi:MAG: hypothetical protein JNM93_02520 [Bacteriovoracaceae bacterium]|nr:hypothetical protein [Bacteriovoracaceae bacterium]